MAAANILALDLPLDKKRLWNQLRIDGSQVRRALDWYRLVDGLREEARGLIEARGAFRLFEVERLSRSEVRLAGGEELVGLRQGRLLAEAERLALGAVTLGPRLEERSNRLAIAGDYPEASVLSIIADCALGEAQERVRALASGELGAEAAPGAVLQPGMQYWGIEGNALFARLLPLEAMGVRLLDSFALHPSKSKSFACLFRRATGAPAR